MGDREGVAKWPNLFATAVGAFVAGMIEVFGWRVLHGGIALLFVGVLLVAFGTGFVIRRARKRAEIASKLGYQQYPFDLQITPHLRGRRSCSCRPFLRKA
jgi:hypothetical protein